MPTVVCGESLSRAGVPCVCALCLFSRLGSCASQVGVRAVSHPAHPQGDLDAHQCEVLDRPQVGFTAAGVSCKRAVRDLCVKTSVVVTLETSTSRVQLEDRNYCS